MSIDEKKLAQFLLLIQKMVGYSLKHTEHQELSEDIANETFIKLYKSDFFESYSLTDDESKKIATAYIKKTISSCRDDYFVKNGIYRRSTKRELESTGRKTQAINQDDFEDAQLNSSHSFQSSEPTSENYFFAQKAYGFIQNCFKLAIEKITDPHRAEFLYQAFWESNNIDFSLNELAKRNNYSNTNPTQDFNRFVAKVSHCTEKNNITIVKSGEQIEFLRQMISSNGELA